MFVRFPFVLLLAVSCFKLHSVTPRKRHDLNVVCIYGWYRDKFNGGKEEVGGRGFCLLILGIFCWLIGVSEVENESLKISQTQAQSHSITGPRLL